jgi:hypothetical protein
MEYPDPGINEREAAVLGLLCENPQYGYTIEKIIEERGYATLDRYRLFLHLLRVETARAPKPGCQLL